MRARARLRSWPVSVSTPGTISEDRSSTIGQHGAAGTLTQLTDEELIAGFQNGSEPAFNVLVGRYKNQLTNFVFRFMGDPEEAYDVVQETFIRVFRNRNAYKPVAKFSTWIYTIASNLAKSRLRRRKLRQTFSFSTRREEPAPEFDIPDESSRADSAVEASMTEERIQKALDELPAKFREVVVMRDIEELSYEEICAITRLPMGTVKSRINRARAQLQESLRDLLSD